jgi:hypothetical protein
MHAFNKEWWCFPSSVPGLSTVREVKIAVLCVNAIDRYFTCVPDWAWPKWIIDAMMGNILVGFPFPGQLQSVRPYVRHRFLVPRACALFGVLPSAQCYAKIWLILMLMLIYYERKTPVVLRPTVPLYLRRKWMIVWKSTMLGFWMFGG